MAATAHPSTGTLGASIIIPHLNDEARLAKCLSALVPQLAGHGVEIIVADNGSRAPLALLQAEFPGVRFIAEPKAGAAAARNAGVAASTAPLLFFTDADCVPAPDWVAQALQLASDTHVIGGAVSVFDETPRPRTGAQAFETVFAFPQADYVQSKGFSVTANLLATRAMFDAVGGFDSRMAEDMDWCHRARAAGYPVRYAPALKVSHPTRSDWPALVKKWRRITSEGYFYAGTSAAARLRWGARSLLLIASVPVHGLRILGHPALTLPEKLRALGVLVRLRVLRTGWTVKQALLGEAPLARG